MLLPMPDVVNRTPKFLVSLFPITSVAEIETASQMGTNAVGVPLTVVASCKVVVPGKLVATLTPFWTTLEIPRPTPSLIVTLYLQVTPWVWNTGIPTETVPLAIVMVLSITVVLPSGFVTRTENL